MKLEILFCNKQSYFTKSNRKKYSRFFIGYLCSRIAHAKTGTVWAPNIPGWDDYPLLEELQKELENKNIKIKIDSDRACYILGEVWKGNARGLQ